jgi:hypothetical protein
MPSSPPGRRRAPPERRFCAPPRRKSSLPRTGPRVLGVLAVLVCECPRPVFQTLKAADSPHGKPRRIWYDLELRQVQPRALPDVVLRNVQEKPQAGSCHLVFSGCSADHRKTHPRLRRNSGWRVLDAVSMHPASWSIIFSGDGKHRPPRLNTGDLKDSWEP